YSLTGCYQCHCVTLLFQASVTRQLASDPLSSVASRFCALRGQNRDTGTMVPLVLCRYQCACAANLFDQRRDTLWAGNQLPEARGVVEAIGVQVSDRLVLRRRAQ